jgi:hypothetical protein
MFAGTKPERGCPVFCPIQLRYFVTKLLLVVMALAAVTGLALAGLTGHTNEDDGATVSDGTLASSWSSHVPGAGGTWPTVGGHAQTNQNGYQVAAQAYAYDGSVLDVKASDYGLTSNFQWECDIQYKILGQVDVQQYSGQTNPPTSYRTTLYMSVGFVNWAGWPDWNAGDTKTIERKNEAAGLLSDSVEKRVTGTRDNVDHIEVGFLHQLEWDAEIDRAEPVVYGDGRPDGSSVGGWVKLWDRSQNPRQLVDEWQMP